MMDEERNLLTPPEVARCLGWKPRTVLELIQEGKFEAYALPGREKQRYQVTRRSVLLFLAETAQFEPSNFPQRVNALLSFLTRDQLAATAAEVAKLLKNDEH
jgi:excisionase family DNA binding protein